MRFCFRLLAGWSSAVVLATAQTPYYLVSTVAGAGKLPYAGDGRAATSVYLFEPERVVFDRAGNLFFTEQYYHRIFRVSTQGTLSSVAGNGETGFSGDGGPATASSLGHPSGIAVDAAGNLYVGTQSRIRKISPDGAIRTIAGSGVSGYAGDGGPALAASMNTPADIVIDPSGNIYFADNTNHVVRRIDLSGVISTVAGTGVAGFSGDNGPAKSAKLNGPSGLALDSAGNLFIADTENNRIRRVRPDGTITTYAGTGEPGEAGDDGPATFARITRPVDLAVSGTFLYMGNYTWGYVRRVSPVGVISTACTTYVTGIAASPSGDLAVADGVNRVIHRMNSAGSLTPLAGIARTTAIGDNGPATSAILSSPAGVAVDSNGVFFVADSVDNRVRRIGLDGVITTIAGTGVFNNTGDNGQATAAALNQPRAVAVDKAGNVFVTCNARIRRIQPSGVITTVVGTGQLGYGGDGGLATRALIYFPDDITLDANGNLYIADTHNHRVRKVDPGGDINTIAGTGQPGYSDNGELANASQLNFPSGVAVDASGNVYIADTNNHRVRKVSRAGVITDFAGTGQRGDSGDGGPALKAQLELPYAVAVDGAGNVFITTNWRVRRVSPDGLITTVAGGGGYDFGGDGGLATLAGMEPYKLAADPAGRVYLSDTTNYRIRRLEPVQIFPEGVTNAASYAPGAVAPGEIIAISGFAVGPPSLTVGDFSTGGVLGTQVSETRILFDDVPAPILYAWANQSSAIVPYATAGKTTTHLQIEYKGRKTNSLTLGVAPSAPGIFTLNQQGTGQGVIFDPNVTPWVLNSAAHPAPKDSVIGIYATGEGQTSPPGQDGRLTLGEPPLATLPVSVTIGGKPAELVRHGEAPGLVAGLYNLYVKVPKDAPSGCGVKVVLTVGQAVSPPDVTMCVQ